VMHLETEDLMREDFEGEERYNRWMAANDMYETFASRRYRLLALPVLVLFLCILFGFQINMTLWKSFFKDDVGKDTRWLSGGVVSIGLITIVMQEIFAGSYHYVATSLTRNENWKTESSEVEALGFKLVIFQIFNYYLVLMLTAFYGENGKPCTVHSQPSSSLAALPQLTTVAVQTTVLCSHYTLHAALES
jgi:hypothetical protein